MAEHTMTLSLTISATPDDVFKVLNNGDSLASWFAERAFVDVDSKRYDFWGKHTPGAPSQEEGRHELLEYEPAKKLSFAWRLRGADTRVTYVLTPEDSGTHLEVIHSGLPERADQHSSMSDFWYLTLENLRGWVERQSVGRRYDFSEPMGDPVEMDVEIEAPREDVFQALIDPKQLDRYMSSTAKVEPKKGGKYNLGWGEGGPVKILDIVENEKLQLSWIYDKEPDTVLTWTLEDSGGKTRLTLVHSGFGEKRRNDDYGTGWTSFLNLIKGMVETGERWTAPEHGGVSHGQV